MQWGKKIPCTVQYSTVQYLGTMLISSAPVSVTMMSSSILTRRNKYYSFVWLLELSRKFHSSLYNIRRSTDMQLSGHPCLVEAFSEYCTNFAKFRWHLSLMWPTWRPRSPWTGWSSPGRGSWRSRGRPGRGPAGSRWSSSRALSSAPGQQMEIDLFVWSLKN